MTPPRLRHIRWLIVSRVNQRGRAIRVRKSTPQAAGHRRHRDAALIAIGTTNPQTYGKLMTKTILHGARATALAAVVAIAVTLVADVASASAYTPPTGIPGPVACLPGYVWREAVPNDYVCVTPATRSQTAYDNSQKALRLRPIHARFYGCVQGYVWRDAAPVDFVCVTPATNSQAAYDNSQAAYRQVRMVTGTVPSITFNHGVPVGSSRPITVTLYSDGREYFRGRMHDSGWTSYDYGVSLVWRATDRYFVVTHTGHVKGTEECGLCPGSSGSRDDSWPNSNRPQHNSAVASDWANISRGSLSRWVAYANIDWGPITDDLNSFIGDLQAIAPVVTAIFA